MTRCRIGFGLALLGALLGRSGSSRAETGVDGAGALEAGPGSGGGGASGSAGADASIGGAAGAAGSSGAAGAAGAEEAPLPPYDYDNGFKCSVGIVGAR